MADLGDKVVHALIERLLQGVHPFAGSEQQYIGIAVVGLVVLADATGQLQAVHAGHQPVCHHQVGRFFGQLAKGVVSAVGVANAGIAGGGQRAVDHSGGKAGVVHHQDIEFRDGHWRSCCFL